MGVDAIMRVEADISDEELRELCFKAGCTFGSNRFWIEHKSGQRAFTRTEHGFEVQWMQRYYGEGYERGDIFFVINLAEFFEYHIGRCRIFYGGDFSDDMVELHSEERRKLKKHSFRVGRLPYIRSDGLPLMSGNIPGPICDFCNVGERTASYKWPW